MSGGRYNYAYLKVDDEAECTIPYFRGELEEIERDLRGIGKNDAADEVQQYRLFMRSHMRAMLGYGKFIRDLLWSAEWVASSDTGPEAIDKSMEKIYKGKGNDSAD